MYCCAGGREGSASEVLSTQTAVRSGGVPFRKCRGGGAWRRRGGGGGGKEKGGGGGGARVGEQQQGDPVQSAREQDPGVEFGTGVHGPTYGEAWTKFRLAPLLLGR